ncbi:lipocalin family protein [Acinetobacter bereziniae]|nr:lipocalin family protein [Acinetobacter bereziniae]NUG09079.1 lipocalin family protein [Acinetobacter bereziniae]NUG64326.1 lipocalin family protein [Acinetobacter bereziniae]
MQLFKILPKSYTLKNMIIGFSIISATLFYPKVYADYSTLAAVPKLELGQYLGLWYEIARKPMYFQKACKYDVTARYTVNEFGNVAVDNRCIDQNGEELRALGEAFISNEPFNSKFKVSFIPEAIRWMPVGRGDYWVLKIDPEYQMALVGEPKRKYLWLLSRDPHPDETKVTEFLRYAQTVGFNLKDIIRTKQNVSQ